MMATEAIPEIIATPSISPDHELNTEQPIVNGSAEKDENKPDTDNADSIVYSAEPSISGGSDTENSKAETSKGVDEKGHVRNISTVKKPTSFKSVTVNKTFLAAKGAGTVLPSKAGDKGSTGSTPAQTGPSLSAIARPRLVAKSGSGLRDSAPRTAATSNGGKAGAAPDASAVWNKNRPAPPPEPKRFTDEELKQRYGIHLATRLQSDDPGKQANWADIDDDDDDWAPESIEWTDGTKITLPQADDVPIPSPEPTPASIVKEMKAAEASKPRSPAPTQASASPTVKPSTFGSGRAGLVLKGAAEKPTLVAKPPGPPTPVKSPWAPLPPVEKVAPIAIEAPQQQQRFGQRDPQGFQSMPPPAKEIAADDFSRSWRESGNTSRELYNSQSGRYEPVNDARRGSVRSGDVRAHQPAVLQRPMNHDGPAEPSAAFQTHRAGGHDGGYNDRRRTSSNVSAGSGNFTRRTSREHDMPPPHEMLNVRRGSLAAVSDTPSSPRNFSPSGQHQSQRGYQGQAWQRSSPVVSHPSPQSAHVQPAPPTSAPVDNQSQTMPVVYEDPIEVQKKVMRQTRELAIKRRQEEEAREEAAKKERIRIRLEAMGPAPEKKSSKETPKEEKAVPTQIQTREATSATFSDSNEPASVASTDLKVNSEPVPGEPVSEPPQQISVEEKLVEKNSLQEPQTNGFHKQPPLNLSQDGRSSQSWQANSAQSSDRYRPWAPVPAQQSTSRNVWGPPSNDRTLGNGTFNPELSRLPEMHTASRPGPIGPPNAGRSNDQPQQGLGRELYSARPNPIGPPNRVESAQTLANRAAAAKSGWGSLPQKLRQEDLARSQQHEQEASRKRELRESGLEPEAVAPVIREKWQQVALNEDGTRGQIQGTVTTVHDPSQTWKNPSEQSEEATTKVIFEEQDNSHRRPIEPIGNQVPYNETWRPTSHVSNISPPVRGSRFFPNNRDIRLEEQLSLFQRPGSPSPPPPTMADHPAYDGDVVHPHVLLPRPSPVVKLPPPPVLAPIGPPKTISFAAVVQAPAVPLGHQNSAQNSRQDYSSRPTHIYQDARRQEPTAGGWQDKINSLIGRKTSPPKSHAFAVDSSSKNALELPNQQISATVSLPSLESIESSSVGSAIDSKPAAEECFEEQEMGSLPVVKVPNLAPALAWALAPPAKPLPRKFIVSQTTSAEPVHFSQQIANNGGIITIKVPGQEEPKSVSVPVARQISNPRRGGPRGGARGSSSSVHRGSRGRDGSNGFSSPTLDDASTSSSPGSIGRGGRGGRGAFGTSWGRHVSAAVRT